MSCSLLNFFQRFCHDDVFFQHLLFSDDTCREFLVSHAFLFTGCKGTKLSPAFRYFYRANRLQFTNLFVSLHPNIQLKYVFIMARPIRETLVLKGEDAFNFEMRRQKVEHMSKEQRAENRRKLEERIANSPIKIEWCW